MNQDLMYLHYQLDNTDGVENYIEEAIVSLKEALSIAALINDVAAVNRIKKAMQVLMENKN